MIAKSDIHLFIENNFGHIGGKNMAANLNFIFGIIFWQRATGGFINGKVLLRLGETLIRRVLPVIVFFVIFMRNLSVEKR
jgi:hypothetical protein